VRRAIGYAYPYHEDGHAGDVVPPGPSVLPPGFPGRLAYRVAGPAPGRTDPEKAKALLESAGYAPGEYELSWPYVDPENAAVTRTITRALEAAGFSADPFPTTEDHWTSVSEDPKAPVNIRTGGWCSDWPSGAEWLALLFHSQGPANHSGFAEPAVDEQISRILELPIGEQAAAWGELDKTIMTNYAPAFVTSYQPITRLHGAGLRGVSLDNVTTMPTWKDLHVIR
jgi:peptide/nickel transport system substrate-binding protein